MELTPIKKESVWIHMAANSAHMKTGHPLPWKCAVAGIPATYMVAKFVVLGESTAGNFRQNFNPERHPDTNFFAWLEFFGDLEIDKQSVATITLKNPTQ